MGDSTGALHPDMWMVLRQDGFEVESVDMMAEDYLQHIHAHIDSGHPAVLLIKRRQNGHSHWVVLADRDKNNYTIVDSLEDQSYLENEEFFAHYGDRDEGLTIEKLKTGIFESIGHLWDGTPS